MIAAHGLERRVAPEAFRFAVVGLWDTVEALGWPNAREDIDMPNGRYEDQVCNMDKVLHAVALDDNRATMYTPILMSLPRLWQHCADQPGKARGAHVTEVWFAGAHSDVGGGYGRGYLSGVSLNWMLGEVGRIGIGGRSVFPQEAGVYADPLDIVHDAQGNNLLFRRIFKRRARDLQGYAGQTGQTIKVHESAIARLKAQHALMRAEDRTGRDTRLPRTLDDALRSDIAACLETDPRMMRADAACSWLEIVP